MKLIQDDITGLRANWGDIDSFVEQCVRLTTDQALWKHISQEGSKSVKENYTIERMADRVMDVYQETIKLNIQ